jgi:hypothetical protein
MILKAVLSPKSAGSKSSKDTLKIGPQNKKPFIEPKEKGQKDYERPMDERTCEFTLEDRRGGAFWARQRSNSTLLDQ